MIQIPFPFTISRAENVLTSVDSHNKVWEQYIDLNRIMSGVRHSYTVSDMLIKYSEKEHSPVSSIPTNVLRLGTPNSYGDLSMTGLVRDESEGKVKEYLNWNEKGSEQMEILKRVFTQIHPEIRGNIKAELTRQLPRHYMLFCVSIYPTQSFERQKQMQRTNPCYDFMTIITSPTAFAKQLGLDVKRQINTVTTTVFHGPVVYLDEDKVNKFIYQSLVKLRESESFPNILPITEQEIILFVKDKKYQVQQEYRFAVYTPFHKYSEDHILLDVSDGLRKLMFPVK